MAEPWPIDGERLFEFLSDQLVNETGAFSKGVNKGLNIARSAIRNVDAVEPIDPETLPLVQELRKQVDSMNNRLSYIEFWERNLRYVFNSAAEDRAAVKTMRKHCEQTIFELRKELEHVTAERDAAIADLKRIAICKFCANGCAKKGRACFTCDNRECTCKSCFGRRKWEWRGLVAENTTTESEAKANDRT